jgi:hypothetical protein
MTFRQFASAKYTGTGIAIMRSGSSNFTSTVVASGSGLTYASPIVVNPVSYAQWNSAVPTETLSEWQIHGIKTLKKVLSLPENWDSYGSPPPTVAAATTAMAILTSTTIEYFIAPRVVPISGGGLQLEWEIGSRVLELEILDDGSVEYLTMEAGEPHREDRLHLTDDVRPLFLWLLSSDSMQVAA